MSLMSYSRNEIVLLPFPFTDLTARKVRPAVIVGHGSHGDDLLLVPISSQAANIDLPLSDWRMAGLNVPCGIKGQIATIEASLVLKSVGSLSKRDQEAMDRRLRAWLDL
jgi:mRNA interferase MazF